MTSIRGNSCSIPTATPFFSSLVILYYDLDCGQNRDTLIWTTFSSPSVHWNDDAVAIHSTVSVHVSVSYISQESFAVAELFCGFQQLSLHPSPSQSVYLGLSKISVLCFVGSAGLPPTCSAGCHPCVVQEFLNIFISSPLGALPWLVPFPIFISQS